MNLLMSKFTKQLCASTFPNTRTYHWNIAEDAAINKTIKDPEFHQDYPSDKYLYTEKEIRGKLTYFIY